METLPTIDFFGHKVSRLICGGNPLSGYSHFSAEMDWDMVCYYNMPNVQKLYAACWENGINTVQTRGDRFMMRAILEHHQGGGRLQWISQTASEFASIEANIAEIARYEPIAIYHHGTHVDNSWHSGRIDEMENIVKTIHDHGLPAGIGTHIPEVIQYIEEKGWETDFYMGCFYNLARQYKSAPAADQDAYARDHFPADDPARMAKTLRAVNKPCLGFKVLAASRNAQSPTDTRAAFEFAYANLKPADAVVVGMFQKEKNQAAENARMVREILAASQAANG